MSLLLALLYPIAIQYERGGWWLAVAPITILALVVDVLVNYTELALLTWDWPRRGEWTFSTRLGRLVRYDDWRGDVARVVAFWLDRLAPSGRHVR